MNRRTILRSTIGTAELSAKRIELLKETFPRDAGGLMSYGQDLYGLFRRAAYFVERIIQGAKPADLPWEQPTKFELVINLKTPKAQGLIIPQSVLSRADEAIR